MALRWMYSSESANCARTPSHVSAQRTSGGREPGDEGVGWLLHRREKAQPHVLGIHLLSKRRIQRLVLRPHRAHANASSILQGKPTLKLARIGADDEPGIRAALRCDTDRLRGLPIQGDPASDKRPPAFASAQRTGVACAGRGCGARRMSNKRYLIHVAGHNLGLLMRLLIGAGTPKEAVGVAGVFSSCSRPAMAHTRLSSWFSSPTAPSQL